MKILSHRLRLGFISYCVRHLHLSRKTPASGGFVEFNPSIQSIANIKGFYTRQELLKEVPLYSATPAFVAKFGGPLTQKILKLIPASFFAEIQRRGVHPLIEVRLHDLKQGDLPSFPGWHCDGAYRKNFYAQPDLNGLRNNKTLHISCTLSTHQKGVSPTQFLNQPFKAFVDPTHQTLNVWQQVDSQVNKLRNQNIFQLNDGHLIQFNGFSIHRPSQAIRNGLRYFFRISGFYNPPMGDPNDAERGKFSLHEHSYRLLPTAKKHPISKSNTQMAFQSHTTVLKTICGHYSIPEIVEEVGLYQASLTFTNQHAGPLTKKLLNEIPQNFLDTLANKQLTPIVNVRVRNLASGYFPDHPKWHSAVPIESNCDAIISTLSTEINGLSTIRILQNPASLSLKDGNLMQITPQTLYRFTQATSRGWQLFFQMHGISSLRQTKIRDITTPPALLQKHDGGYLISQEVIYVDRNGRGW